LVVLRTRKVINTPPPMNGSCTSSISCKKVAPKEKGKIEKWIKG
jgi:hypothetical protein